MNPHHLGFDGGKSTIASQQVNCQYPSLELQFAFGDSRRGDTIRLELCKTAQSEFVGFKTVFSPDDQRWIAPSGVGYFSNAFKIFWTGDVDHAFAVLLHVEKTLGVDAKAKHQAVPQRPGTRDR